MNSTREHAESNPDIDTNRVINDGKEYENQEFKIREYQDDQDSVDYRI